MGNRLFKAVRVFRGLTQCELARTIGRSQPWLSQVESGKRLPQPEEARKLAEILKITEADIRGW